jgi:hypothetical protein
MKASLTKPAMILKLKGPKEYTLFIYDKYGEKIPSLSSMNESPFVLPGYKFEALQKSMEDIMGKPVKDSK